MDHTQKMIILAFAILLGASFVSASQLNNQNTGVGQKVFAEVERSDYTVRQSLRVYCKYYDVEFCEKGISPFNVFRAIHHYNYVDAESEYRWNQ